MRSTFSRFIMKQGNLTKAITGIWLCPSLQRFPCCETQRTTHNHQWRSMAGNAMQGTAKQGTPPWLLLKQSLDFELKTGCLDFKGKDFTFSEFMQTSSAIGPSHPPLQDEFQQLKINLKNYQRLDKRQRQKVVLAGLALAQEWLELEEAQAELERNQEAFSLEMEQRSENQRVSGSHPGSTKTWMVSKAKKMPLMEDTIATVPTEETMNNQKPRRFDESRENQIRIFQEIANEPEDPEHWEKIKVAKQRTSEWAQQRKDRLTASSFGAILGLLGYLQGDKMMELWEEKLGLREAFTGNKFTEWGTKMESTALNDYKKISGWNVEEHGLKVMQEDEAHQWLAGSPDGIISPVHPIQDMFDMPPNTLRGKGLLEIKCPYGSDPLKVVPKESVQAQYYPQVQGLMDLFDLEWCHLMYWTKNNGLTVFFIPRNRSYWLKAYRLLAEFWWENVVPARSAISRHYCDNMGNGTDILHKVVWKFRPNQEDPRRKQIVSETEEIVKGLKGVFMPSEKIANWHS